MKILVLTITLFLGCVLAQDEDGIIEITDRIVGGSNANLGLAPYQVSLRTVNNNHFCGGSIISNRWIVTAAHCLKAAVPAYSVAGSIFLNSGGTKYITLRAFIHGAYNPTTIINDIGMIQTKESIVFNSYIRAVGIPTTSPPDNTVLTATGWGLTVAGGSSLPNTLQVFYPKVYNQNLCIQKWGRGITTTMMCVFSKVGQGLCQGDSGGPLVYSGVLHGIVSFGKPCAVGFPDVVTRVSSYRTWILAVQTAYP